MSEKPARTWWYPVLTDDQWYDYEALADAYFELLAENTSLKEKIARLEIEKNF